MPNILRSNYFVADAAQLILDHAGRAIAERGQFFLALSGGNTPKAIYAQLATLAPDTSRWVITFGDERCVPPNDPMSNYHMANEAWLQRTTATILRMRGEIEPAAAALDYEEQLERFPDFRHDLVLLGMGDDGHTASLFPNTKALKEMKRRVVSNYVDKLNVWRLTMTFPFINEARAAVFLVNGKEKMPLVETILRRGTSYPCERIAPVDGQLVWLLGE